MSIKELTRELIAVKRDLALNRNVRDNKELLVAIENEIKLKSNLKDKGYKSSLVDKLQNKFERYNPKFKQLDKVNYVGNKITRVRFDENKFDRQSYTIDKVKKIGNKFTKYLNKKNVSGKVMVSVLYGDLGWRSGYFTNIGDDIKVYSPADSNFEMDEPDSIKSFVIYFLATPKALGGNDKFNDCLYNCLEKLIYNLNDYFKSPEMFKKYLGLNRMDKVPIELISKVEQKLKTYQINIRGNYIYTSSIKSQKVLNLTLINEHYDIDKTFSKKSLCSYVSYTEKILLVRDIVSYEVYDGESKRVLTSKERNEIIYDYTSKYIIMDVSLDKNTTLEEEYKKLIPIIDNLKKESNGIINLYKTGSYKNASLDLFDRMTKTIIEPENILQDEALWINGASSGALIWAEQYEGELHKYDVKSLYPYLMTLSTLKFPLQRGEFQHLEKFDEYFGFGIYRCKITKSEDKNINKLFKFNDSNYYTSTSLDHAKKLFLQVELIHDNSPNYLHYPREKLITFGEVFKPFVDFMFKLKEKNIENSKYILNMLWGALCEMDRRKIYDNYENTIADDEEIYDLRPSNKDENVDVIRTHKINKRYKTNYARLCPFLLSKGRSYMSNIMLEHKDNIHRIQTDGFLSDKIIHELRDVSIGGLKYEGYTDNGKILNCINKVNVL